MMRYEAWWQTNKDKPPQFGRCWAWCRGDAIRKLRLNRKEILWYILDEYRKCR